MGFYKPKTINNTDTNGGRMSKNLFTDASNENIFPAIYLDALGSDIVRYRKMFLKIATDDDAVAASAKIAMLRPASADDEVTFFSGTHTDTQADITGSEQQFGCGQLTTDISAGATEMTVTSEAGAVRPVFDDGMLIMISDKTSVSSGTGNREYLTLAASNAVSWNGSDATLTLEAGSLPQNDYLAADTYVSSAIDVPGGIGGVSSAYSTLSSGGTFDNSGNPVMVDAIGGVYENWTLTFDSSINYTLFGDTVGALTGGNISIDFSPNNPDFSKPFLTIPSAAFFGTFVAGDQITFKTSPFSQAIWLKNFTLASASSSAQSKFILFYDVS